METPMTTTPIDQMVDEEAFSMTAAVSNGMAAARLKITAATEVANEAFAQGQMEQAAKLPGKRRVDRKAAQFISARIDGQDIKLQIVPEDLRIYAAAVEPPFAAMSKLIGDEWTPDLVEKTLQLAAIPVEDRETMAKFARYGINTQFGNMPKNPTIARALATRPMAQYARLAALCLMAALLGIPDEEANFSDDS